MAKFINIKQKNVKKTLSSLIIFKMTWLKDFIELIFPLTCGACGVPLEKNEKTICTTCLSDLPLTNFHLYNDNPVSQIFWGRINFEVATALLYFHKEGRTQHLLHNLKYKGRKDIGIFLGKILGNQIMQNNTFNTIDYIIPIPLHPKRQKQRGYNQAECFAQGISEVLNKPINNDVIIRVVETKSQTKKSRIERWKNVEEAFSVQNKQDFFAKHFLIVDDVLTTGATLEACAQTILQLPQSKVSIAVIAKA